MSKDKKEITDNKEINKLLTQYEKKYTVMKGIDIVIEPKIKSIYPLDFILDGGISQALGGHKIEFAGPESSGKTTIAMVVIGKYQELGKKCVFINAENSYDPMWAEILGIDNKKIIVAKPNSLEEAGDMVLDMVKDFDLIVIDSVIALVPEEEIDKSLSDKAYASQAKVISPLCRKLNRETSGGKTAIIFINQVREKIGKVFGNPETTAGGRALKHFYDSRIWFRQGKPIDLEKERIGMEIKMMCQKNKKGKPKRATIIDFYLDGRLDIKKSIFFAGIKFGVIQLVGKTYTFGDKNIVGQDNFRESLTDKEWDTLLKEVYKSMK